MAAVFIFFIVGLLFAATVGIAMVFKVLTEFQPGDNKVSEDLRILKAKANSQLIIDLAPFDKEDLEVLSLDQIGKKIKNRFMVTTGQGIITSIYEEPLITYAYKKYIGPGVNGILYAATSKHEYIYRITNKGTAIQIDGKKVGVLKKNGVLYNRSNKMIARINKDRNELLSPVLVGNKEIASLVNPSLSKKHVPRALDLVDLGLSDEEEEIFTAIAGLELAFNQDQADSLY